MLLAAPLTLAAGGGSTIRGGVRNPSSNRGDQFTSETQIIAQNSSYGTRQSNKGSGGGAIYGCRSAVNAPACVAAYNLNVGHAFDFRTGGLVGGTITLRDPKGAPLSTNATGVATGFNANFLQGKQAKDFIGKADQAADSAKLAGQPASAYAFSGDLLFGIVAASGALQSGRGATSAASIGAGRFSVKFARDVSKCSYTASPVGSASAHALGVAGGSDPSTVTVDAGGASASGFHLQVIC